MITLMLLLTLSPFVACRLVKAASLSTRFPVILIPGNAASQLEGKINTSTSEGMYCRRITPGYVPLWMSFAELLPLEINCLFEYLRLWYNPITHKTHNTPGVKIRVPDFGNTSSVEFVDQTRTVQYYHTIVEDLVSFGYSRGVSVRGAPYDFRKAPNELNNYFVQLKQLVEDTYAINNNTKVVVIAHSMGNPVFVYFLNRQPQTWKDKFIQDYISLAGAWGGAVSVMEVMTSGFNFGISTVIRFIIRELQRSQPSTAFMMPTKPFWNASEVLISTPNKNYSISNYNELFEDMGYPTGYLIRKDTEHILPDLIPPQVRLHCIHGSNVPTASRLVFGEGEFPNSEPLTLDGDGDGIVNMPSLLGCLRWIGQQKYPVIHRVYSGATSNHMALLVNPDVRMYIRNIVTGKI